MGDWGSLVVGSALARIIPDRAVYGYDPNFDVQAHLEKFNSVLAKLKFGGTFGFGAKRAADIISDIARQHDVKAQYLLVSLDREQGLVSGNASRLDAKDPKLKRAITWATGYGAWHGKPEAEWSTKWQGFEKQLAGAASAAQQARTGRGPYASVPEIVATKRPIKLLSPPGAQVTPANIASAMLYVYTPSRNTGVDNQNLFKRHAPDLVA